MRISVLTMIFLLFMSEVWAQTEGGQVAEKDSGAFRPFPEHFYIEATGGAQLLISEDVENLDFNDRFTSSFSLSAGKWFSPVWGASVKIQGFSLNGFSTTEGIYTATTGSTSPFDEDPVRKEVTINPDGTYRHFIRYANLSLNAYLSLVNLFTEFNGTTRFDLIPSVGIGNMHVFQYKGVPANNSLSVNLGVTGKFCVTPRFDVAVSANAAVFDNDFEGRIAGSKSYDKYVSASAGIVYYFKDRRLKEKAEKNMDAEE
ncbi:hypothetical protein SAMN05444280_11826 [Tangfeifania diversioriginum]|uniref:Outer membrane protein beta-barrel domain-containing protein n=1 Tax=Tangfeifania diversioriginum TaxID=1168035 RepID=A0A1M6IXF8_9BACT|nr:hypothetical protein [Tangfeifania diversioriginum]SHJ39094.1 hypothetical protein SAMN05444280_11826 [Tangfeifania diversioriginum]